MKTKAEKISREFNTKTKLVDVVELYGGAVTLEFSESRHTYTIYDDEHPYPGKGRIAPGVTTIIDVLNKPLLVPWAAKTCGLYLQQNWKPGRAYTEAERDAIIVQMKREHRRVKEDAADVGSTVHAWIESHVKSILGTGELLPWPEGEREQEAVTAFLQWEQEHSVKYLQSEFRCYSRQYHYAGTSDLDFIVDGRRAVGDLKTSNGIWPEMGMQLAAYQKARVEEAKAVMPDYGVPGEASFSREKYDKAIEICREYETRWIIRCGKDGALEFREFPNYEADLRGFFAAKQLHEWQKGATNGKG